jgi:hypothetical protein
MSTGLMGCWLLNEGPGKLGYVKDYSGYGTDGRLALNAAPATCLKYGSAVEVFEDDSCINFGTTSLFDFTSEDFTIVVLWGSETDPTFNKRIVGRSAVPASNGWQLLVDFPIDQVAFQTGSGGGLVETTSNNVLIYDGRIHHIVVTRSGTTVKIYIDGVDQTDSSGSHADPASVAAATMYLGRHQSASLSVPGKFAGYMVYNRTLSATEVHSLYVDPFQMFYHNPIELWVGSAASVAPSGNAGIMTTNTGWWGPTY